MLKSKLTYQQFMLYLAVIISFSFSTITIDQFIKPKILLALLGLLLVYFRFKVQILLNFKDINSLYKILIVVILLTMSLSALVNHQDMSSALLGTFGRNLGIVHFLIFGFVFLLNNSPLTSNHFHLSLRFLTFSGIILTVYGFFQASGIDLNKLINLGSPVILTFGNNNYASSFIGITAFANLALLFTSLRSITMYKTFLCCTMFMQLLVLYLIRNVQGPLLFIFGVLFFSNLYLLNRSKVNNTFGYVLILLNSSIFLLLIIFIARIEQFYGTNSVQDRIFFWNVAVDMIKSNPIFGVGVDSYGDWFGRFSLFEQNQSYSYSGTSNNAHSVLLQISSTTGLITGLSYLLFLMIVFYRAIQNCKLYSGNITFYALFTVWLLWVIQSFFSIDNLGVSIWGWSVSGIIGTFKAPHFDSLKKSSKLQFISIGKIRAKISTVLVITFLTLPTTYLVNNLANEVRIRTSIIRFVDIPIKNVKELDLNSKQLLLLGTQSSDPELRMYVAKYMLRKNSIADALELISLTTKEFPNYSKAWNLQAIIYENLKQFDKAIGPRKMTTFLEPRNKRHLENLNKDLTELGIK